MDFKIQPIRSMAMIWMRAGRRLGWYLMICWVIGVEAQQRADSQFASRVPDPAYKLGKGPLVLIDEGHHNFHTAAGRYAAFADLVKKDGFRVTPHRGLFRDKSLSSARILVIANALHESNADSWALPTPSAFTAQEIKVVREWVADGGRLLLIADHMPFPGAAALLGREFGASFGNGYASGPDGGVFRIEDGLLRDHPIIRGRSDKERITQVRTFTGQAFQATAAIVPLLVFGEGHSMRLPQRAGRVTPETPRVDVQGWLHAGARRFGKGRVVIFGEAALFTAQVSGGARRPMGMNAPGAEQNQQLCLNVMHWLSGLIEPDED